VGNLESADILTGLKREIFTGIGKQIVPKTERTELEAKRLIALERAIEALERGGHAMTEYEAKQAARAYLRTLRQESDKRFIMTLAGWTCFIVGFLVGVQF